MREQLPFEGDTFIPLEIIKLRDRFNLKNCIETGTEYGTTTKEFCKIFDSVITIEASEENYVTASSILAYTQAACYKGMSEDVLKEINLRDNTFFYLDAHGNGICPLKKELEVIASKKLKNICVAIHDFKVPGKDFGFDTYDFELCYEEIEPYLKLIYPAGFDYHYNSEANGARQGIIYIYPKQ